MNRQALRLSAWLILGLLAWLVAGLVGQQGRTAAAPLFAPPPVDFAPAVDYNLHGKTRDLISADFNNDGKPDLAGVQWDTGKLFVQLNAGDGTFLPESSYQPDDEDLWALDSGDLNNDGKLDLAAVSKSARQMSAFMGQGDGNFQIVINYIGADPSDIRLADINHDFRLDAVITSYTWNNREVRFGRGNGSFGRLDSYNLMGAGFGVTVADLDGDSWLDLVEAKGNNNQILVSWGMPDGTFQLPQPYLVGAQPVAAAVGDIDGDGDLDIAVANRKSANLSLLAGAGARAFTALAPAVAPAASAVALKDLNGDGALDLVSSNSTGATTPGTISVNLGNGDGTFQPAATWTAGIDPAALAVADFNQDGVADVATGNYGALNAGVSVLMGVPLIAPSPTPTSPPLGTPTATATATASPTVAPTATPGGKTPRLFMPRTNSGKIQLLATINPVAIPNRPVIQPGEVYYTHTFTLTTPMPASGKLYLSGAPDRIAPIRVDDMLVFLINGDEYEMSTMYLTELQTVEVWPYLAANLFGAPVTAVFHDDPFRGGMVGSSPVWLIWVP